MVRGLKVNVEMKGLNENPYANGAVLYPDCGIKYTNLHMW